MEKKRVNYKDKIIVIIVSLIIVGLFIYFKDNKELMDFIQFNILYHIRIGLNTLFSLINISITEIIVAAAIIWFLVITIKMLIQVIFKHDKISTFIRWLFTSGAFAAFVVSLFCLLWGVGFYTSNLQDRMDVQSRNSTTEELYETTVQFADMASKYSSTVSRDENGIMNTSLDEIFYESTDVYTNISDEYEALKYPGDEKTPKKMISSVLMSYWNTTGVTFPLTYESNINTDAPICLIPVTIAHELAHQRCIASEKEANFAGILSSTTCDSDTYKYSGYLLGYIYLGNALYKENPDLYYEAMSHLSDSVIIDLQYNNEYWKQFETQAKEISDKLYDSMLKTYGEESGSKSYGEVVDLLVTYYQDYEGFKN